jgi:hypothetical protein
MSLPRFKDFGKATNNLLFKEGFDVKYGAKVEAKSGDAKFNAEWNQDGSDVTGNVKAEITQKVPLDCTLTVTGTVDTGKKIQVEDVLKGLATGVDLLSTLRLNDKKAPNAFTVGARYKQSNVDAEFSVDTLGSTHDLEVAASTGTSGFFGGLRAVLSLTPPEVKVEKKEGDTADAAETTKDYVKDYALAAGYIASDFEVSVTTEKKASVINAGFLHHLSSEFDVGAMLKYNRKAKTDEDPYTLTVGTAYKVDGTTSKVRVDTNGDVLGSFSAPVKGNATITLVGKVSTIGKSSTGVGLQVALK